MKKAFKIAVIVPIILIIGIAFSAIETKTITSDKADSQIVSTMDSIRLDRDKALLPLEEKKLSLEEQITGIDKEFSLRIDSFKNLLSKKYYDETMEMCKVRDVQCEDRKKNITLSQYSSNPVIETAEASEKVSINVTDYEKLDKWFASKHSPLNGYGYSFVKYAKQYGVDSDFGVCITWSDSRAGKMLTTANNWGNVHNNDRGDRVGFETPQEGIEAIFQLIGEGTYQQENHIIGDFSNGGRIKINKPTSENKGVFVYATSKYNWNKNVLDCMKELKGQPINEYYQVRLTN